MKQTVKVLEYMKDFGSITTMDAFLDLGVTRLASRVHELNQMGYNISKTMEKVRTATVKQPITHGIS